MKLCGRKRHSKKTLASFLTTYFDNKYRIVTIILLFFCTFFVMPSNNSYASEGAENFYDYVRDERLNEIIGTVEEDTELFVDLTQRRRFTLFFGRTASLVLTLFWCLGVYFFRKKHFPASDKKDVTYDNNVLSVFFTKKPVEVSAIINLNEFTKDDLIATVFDLIRLGFFAVTKVDAEYRIFFDKSKVEKSKTKLENYEDFLIRWFITKIGGGEYFCFRKLSEYLKVDSQASEFDIDYDVWLDELSEFACEKKIIDKDSETWKALLTFVGAAYAFLGVLLLYLTGSSAVVLLFVITFLSHRLSLTVIKRTKKAEHERIMLLHSLEYLETVTPDVTNFENFKELDLYFVYCLCVGKKEIFLKNCEKYAELYLEMEEMLSEAIIYASGIINSGTD